MVCITPPAERLEYTHDFDETLNTFQLSLFVTVVRGHEIQNGLSILGQHHTTVPH